MDKKEMCDAMFSDLIESTPKPLRVIIAGCRDFHKYSHLLIAAKTFEETHGKITTVVCGCSEGVDILGAAWAGFRGIPIDPYPVTKTQWREMGKVAGPIRNRQMAENADGLIALWDRKSRGTKNMIEEAEKRGLKILVQYITEGLEG